MPSPIQDFGRARKRLFGFVRHASYTLLGFMLPSAGRAVPFVPGFVLRMLSSHADKEIEMGCYNSCVIPASADEVWKAMRPFHAMPWAPNAVQSVDAVGEVPDGQPGAKRILNGLFHETLSTVDDEARTFSYTIDDGPAPVSKETMKGYTGVVRVRPITSDGTSFVEWSSTWDEGEGGIAEFCSPIYQALLTELRAHFS